MCTLFFFWIPFLKLEFFPSKLEFYDPRWPCRCDRKEGRDDWNDGEKLELLYIYIIFRLVSSSPNIGEAFKAIRSFWFFDELVPSRPWPVAVFALASQQTAWSACFFFLDDFVKRTNTVWTLVLTAACHLISYLWVNQTDQFDIHLLWSWNFWHAYHIWLVVWNIFYFSMSWECHHPNWLSLHHFSEG